MKMRVWNECWNEAEENIEKLDINKICKFGIKVLDDALIGMLPNDFIVIGADSGVGKSETALDIAIHNASNGKTVALYFIEGGSEEAINRIRWKMMIKKYYSEKHTGIDMDYRKWRLGLLKHPLIKHLNDTCYEEFKNKVSDRLKIYSFNEGLTIDYLIQSLDYFFKPEVGFDDDPFSYKQQLDLIIIDHLQYFTLSNPKNELTEMTQILTKVNNITQHNKIPVVLISHLRKKEKDRGLPNQEDFFGTSNIPKIASVTITMAPYYVTEQCSREIYPTFFRFAKSRTGIRQSYAALCNFNTKNGGYEKEYKLYKLIGDKPDEKEMEEYNLPKWAKRKEVNNDWTD